MAATSIFIHEIQSRPNPLWAPAWPVTVSLGEQHHWISRWRERLPLDVAVAPDVCRWKGFVGIRLGMDTLSI